MPFIRALSGKLIKVPEGLSDEEALDLAKGKFPKEFADTRKAEEGFIPSIKSGAMGLASNVATAAAPLLGMSDDQTRRMMAKDQARQMETSSTPSWEDTKEAFAKHGVLGGEKDSERGGLGQLMRMWRGQLGESLPQMGATMAGARLGAGVGSLAGPGGTLAGGALGALAGSLPGFIGSNVKRQADEQEQAGTKAPLDYASATAAAVPQAGVDAASTLFVLGRLGMGKVLTKSLEDVAAKAGVKKAEEVLARTAQASLLRTGATGAAKGVAVEMPTEIAQAVLERAQAGLNLFDEDARKEYEATAVGVAGPGAVFGVAGGISGRSAARDQVQEIGDLRAQQAAAEAKKKADAEAAALAQVRQAKMAEAEGGYAPEGQGRLFGGEATPLPVAGSMQQLYKQMQEAEANGDTQTASQLRNDMQRLQSELQNPEALAQRRQQLQDARDGITEQIQAVAGKDPAAVKELRQKGAAITSEINRVDALLKQAPPSPSREQAEKKLKAVEKQLETAKRDGDEPLMDSLGSKVFALKNDLAQSGDLLAGVPSLAKTAEATRRAAAAQQVEQGPFMATDQGRLFDGEAFPLPVKGKPAQILKMMQAAEAAGATAKASQLRNDYNRAVQQEAEQAQLDAPEETPVKNTGQGNLLTGVPRVTETPKQRTARLEKERNGMDLNEFKLVQAVDAQIEARDAKARQLQEEKERAAEGAVKRATDINKFAEQRNTQMFNWGNEIDSLRKGDNVGDVSRRAAELRAEQIALLSRMEALKRVEQMGGQMSIPAQEQLENAVQQWLGRITKNAKPGNIEGALQSAMREKFGQGPIERGMTITDTKTGELARLQQGVDRLITRAVEQNKLATAKKSKKKVGPFGLTQQSAAMQSQRYDEQQAAAEPEVAPEPNLSGKQREMFPGSVTEVTKKKQAVEKRTATVESKKQAKLEETKALMQKATAEKAEKDRKLARRKRVADFQKQMREQRKKTSARNSEERLKSLATLQDKLDREIAATKAELETERLANVKLQSLASLGKLTNVKFSGETQQHLRGLEAQLASVKTLILKAFAKVEADQKRFLDDAKRRRELEKGVRVPAGQIVQEDKRPALKPVTPEEKADRAAAAEMRNRVETQEDFVAEAEQAIDAKLRRLTDMRDALFAPPANYKARLMDGLEKLEKAGGRLSPTARKALLAEAEKEAEKAGEFGRQNFKKRLEKESAELQRAKKDLSLFKKHWKELIKQEASLKREQQVKALRQRVLDAVDKVAASMKRTEQVEADRNRTVEKVLSDLAQGKIKGQRGIRTEQVATTLTPAQEKKIAAIEDKMDALGEGAKDRMERAALQLQIDQVRQGAYASIKRSFGETSPSSDMDIADLEAAQVKKSGALKIEQREEQPVGRMKPAKEIKRVRDRYLAMRAAGKERQAQAFREKHIDLFLGPLEGLVRGVESREGKRTPQPLKTGTKTYDPEFTTDRDNVDLAGLGQQRRALDGEPDLREATDADTGVDPVAAKEIADRVQAALPSGVNFIYAPTLADAPADFQAFMAKTGRKAAKGAVMPDGRVIVVGEAHSSPKDVEETIAHELIGHYGADVILGPDGVAAMVADLTKKGVDHMAEVATGLGLFPDVATARMAMPKNVDEKVMTVLVREMIAHAAEGRRVAPRFAEKVKTFIRDLISKVRGFFRNAGLSSLARADTKAIQKILNDAEKALSSGRVGVYRTPDGETVFRGVTDKPEGMPDELWELTNALVGGEGKRWQDQTRAKLLGIAATTAFDSKAPVKLAAEIGTKKGLISDMEAVQNIYHLSQHDKAGVHTIDTVQNGPRELVKSDHDGETIWQVMGKEGPDQPSLLKMFKALDKSGLTPDQYDITFTLFLASKRIKNEGVGIYKLNYRTDEKGKPLVTKEKLEAFEKYIASNKRASDAFEEARDIYNKYNEGLINFNVQTGAMSKELADMLKAKKDFIPFYREKNGEFELVFDDASTPVNVGNIKDQPYLHELVGGDQRILPIFQSSVTNTRMLTDMALRNLATKDTAFLLSKLGMTEDRGVDARGKKQTVFTGMGAAGPNILRFKVDGEDAYIKVKTEGTIFEDIPSELLVKGLEGIKTTFPPSLRLLGFPAKLLRHFIVLSPVYPIRSLIRESVSAWGTSGANFVPVLGPLKSLAKAWSGDDKTVKQLQREGLGGGQLLSGLSSSEEMAKILRSISSGKTTWGTALAWAESKSMLSDTGIRAAAYNSFIKQKLNPVRAWVATNEILDYNRRGMSPALYIANTLFPFFTTQMQGLSVMYRAMTGRMPMNDRLKIQEKFIRRGIGLGVMTMAYVAMMQDDEAYKNATPEVRLANWFVRVPGLDEPLKIPIPFEFGLLFKAIPEVIFNDAFSKEDFAPVGKALAKMALNSVPGAGSYFMPQVAKPIISQATGVDLFTGADIETRAMKKLDPAERYKDNTTELAKTLGAGAGVSPARIDQFIKDVGSGTLLSLVSLANSLLAGDNPPSASMKTSKYLIVGGLFQPTDAGAIINRVYEQMEEAVQAKNTYTKLLEEGREEKAEQYLNGNLNRIMMADSAPSFRDSMNQLTAYEKAIRADRNMLPEEKRETLDEIRRQKIDTAKQYRDALRQAA